VTEIVSTIPKARLLPAVHGLRGLAATSVVLFHLHHLTKLALPQPLGFVGSHFGLGVQLFFVLSAFSLCYSTVPSIGKPGWNRDYFIKRLFRIAPLFYAMLGAWVALFYVRHATPGKLDLMLNLMFAYNFVPGKHESIVQAGWTIGVEMIFYAILPIVLLLVGRIRHALAFFVIAALLSLICRAAFVQAGGILEQYAHFAFITSLGVFAIGILGFWAYRSLAGAVHDANAATGALKVQAVLIGVVLCLFAWLVSPLGNTLYTAGRADIMMWSLLFGVVIVWQALFPLRPLASAVMEFLGERSYSIYLLHPMVIFFLTPINERLYTAVASLAGAWAFVVCGAFTLSIVVACAAVTYRFIEVHGIQLGRLLVVRARGPQPGKLRQAV